MARITALSNEQLPEHLSRQAQAGDESGAGSTVLRVLGHRPDLMESYFKFYYPLHNGGIVDPLAQGNGPSQNRVIKSVSHLKESTLSVNDGTRAHRR
jgi:hypothetical protein